MCGIIGKAGVGNVTPELLEGLGKLEYRGYDSAGIAVLRDGRPARVRAVGKIANLRDALDKVPLEANVGVGHTRWATHGAPSEANAHPHNSPDGKFTLVHNGIIENADALKRTVLAGDEVWESETDTEVVAHLLQKFYTGDVVKALAETQKHLKGSYALGILCADYPDTIFAAALGSPLIAASVEDGSCIASDVGAIGGTLSQVYKIENREICALTQNEIRFYTPDGEPCEKATVTVVPDALSMDKGGYEHYMLYEIMQQPSAVRKTLEPLLAGDFDLGFDDAFVRDGLKEIRVVACGSAYHTGLAAQLLFERFCRVPCRAEIASEFRYADPVVDAGTLTIFVSQSGETADTLAALRLAKERGAKVLSIVNVRGSAIASESDAVIYTNAGREIAVATTKAYSAQLAVFYALAVRFAAARGTIDGARRAELTHELAALPDKIQEAIDRAEAPARKLAESMAATQDIFFIGRRLDFAASMEASLKMKEISYINSQAYAAGELKHGTISLVEEGTPVVSIAMDGGMSDKTHSNMSEVRARGALTIAVTGDKNADAFADADVLLTMPDTDEWFTCSLAVVPMQLLSYYTAKNRGCDIDKPKNLAKSVTVE